MGWKKSRAHGALVGLGEGLAPSAQRPHRRLRGSLAAGWKRL